MSRGKVRGTFGESAGFTKIFDDLVDSAAFIALPDSAQRVMLDFLHAYGRATHFDTADPKAVSFIGDDGQIRKVPGIEYSFGDCRLAIGRTTFYAALKHCRKHGFLRRLQTANGAPFLWWPSVKWKAYPETGVGDVQAARIAAVRRRRCLHAQETRTRQLRLELFAGPGIQTHAPAPHIAHVMEPDQTAQAVGDLTAQLARKMAIR